MRTGFLNVTFFVIKVTLLFGMSDFHPLQKCSFYHDFIYVINGKDILCIFSNIPNSFDISCILLIIIYNFLFSNLDALNIYLVPNYYGRNFH